MEAKNYKYNHGSQKLQIESKTTWLNANYKFSWSSDNPLFIGRKTILPTVLAMKHMQKKRPHNLLWDQLHNVFSCPNVPRDNDLH